MKFLPSVPQVLTVSSLWMAGMVILSKLNGQNNDCDYPTYCPPMLICFNTTGNWILCCNDEYDPGLFPYNNEVCINDCPEVCNSTNPNPPIESGPAGKPWWAWVLGFGTPIAAGICGFACYLSRKKNKPDDLRAKVEEIKERVDEHDRTINLHLGDQREEVIVGEDDEEEKPINADYYRVYDGGDDDEQKNRDAVSSKALVKAKIVRQEKKSKENEEDDDYSHGVSLGSADSSFNSLP